MTPEERDAKTRRMEAAGLLDPNCKYCQERYYKPAEPLGGPSHKASAACRSGARPHCTCDACY